MLPEKSALTDYSYRLGHDHQQQRFLAALDQKMIGAGLATAQDAIFDLDFHAVMHWGTDPVLEKHYVPTRSQRSRSVLTFFAQDTGTHNLVYGNADLTKATQNREVIAFCDRCKALSGKDPAMLVMDQNLTTQQVLGELDARGVKFAQALLAAFRARLGPGYAAATPDTLQRRFLDTPATILTDNDTTTVVLNHRAYSPVLRQSDLPTDTTVPWWQGHRLRLQYA